MRFINLNSVPPALVFVTVMLVFVLSTNGVWAHPEEGLGEHVVEACRLDGIPPPKIDGRLDDAAWQCAKPVNGFIQLVPDRGQPATDDTEFYIAYDRHHLYVAFRCYDAAPDKVVNRLVRRDRNIYDSDVISFFMDPHHDHRTGYKFATTPGGVQSDAYRFDDIRSDSSWRGIWWLETQIDEQGWTSEFKIPFANFRFSDQQEQVWGFDVERVNRRKNEVTVWKQMTQAGATTRMSDLGHLVKLRDISGGKQFEVSPYVLSGGAATHDESLDGQLGVGLDVQYNLTGALKSNATVNPDFAQVEADQLAINLTRFPTRFPERRPFFVEGNSFFETPLELFFSRRIGSRGDILWGGKMTGKVGDYSVGLLGSQTGSFGALEIGQEPALKEEALYSAVRLKRDIFNRSSVGLIFVDKERIDDREGDERYSRVGGFDTDLFFLKTYQLSGQYATSFNPGLDTKNKAYLMELTQSNYLWNARVGLERVEPLFETNQTGFLRKEKYRGWQQINIRTTYIPWLGRDRVALGADGRIAESLFTDAYFTNWQADNPNLTLSPKFEEDSIAWEANLSVDFRFTESFLDDLGVFYRRSREVELTEVFMADGYGFSVDTNTARPVAVGMTGEIRDFFNFDRQAVGKQRQLSLFSTVRPQTNFTLELESSYAQSLDQEDTIDGRFLVSSLRVTYLFTRDAFVRVFTQAGRDRTSFDDIETDENYLISVLLGWEYSPKSHLFVAYNEDWSTVEDDLRLNNRVVVFKISYLSNF
ncbi:MAG: DUF5916 domain-containing protein [Candidatus Poribacteria bacterium]|nr:DUF5916 domain-containing protein [Candidatus Poribacteria bacterium]